MPRKANHSKRPEYVALEIMGVGKTVTPTEIDSHVGVGKYSSKYISFLKRDGYVITTNKNGRNVVSYTLVSKPEVEPAAAAGRVAKTPKLAKAAKAKTKADKPVKAPKAAKPAKEKPAKKAKAASTKKNDGFVLPAKKKAKTVKTQKEAVEEFAPSDVMTSYSIDPDFDGPSDFDPRDIA